MDVYLKVHVMDEEPVKVVYCCCPRDEDQELRRDLAKQIDRIPGVQVWHDGEIPAGIDRAKCIDDHLNYADIILLLVSPDFLNYFIDDVINNIMERQRRDNIHVIP